MMKRLYVDIRPWDKNCATTALESGADALVIDRAADAAVLSRVTTVAPDGDLVPGRDIFEVRIADEASQEEAMALARKGQLIVHTDDWTVIPLENLVAVSDQVIAAVHSLEEARLALTVLEKGTGGIMIQSRDPATIRAIAALVQEKTLAVDLVPLTVTSIQPAGMGDRVCIDTCSMLLDGEGMLIGNTSSGFLLVHAETLDNPYVAPRPFRVNAGAVCAYILLPDGKTAYLSDLVVGDRVLVPSSDGSAREVTIGRLKIERRPLLLVEVLYEGNRAGLVLQNAETIRLVTPGGGAISVVSLCPGDVIMGHITRGGRHFGMAIEESIIEK